jgi:hypothetical protein
MLVRRVGATIDEQVAALLHTYRIPPSATSLITPSLSLGKEAITRYTRHVILRQRGCRTSSPEMRPTRRSSKKNCSL